MTESRTARTESDELSLEIARLRAELRAELREELLAELRAELRAELTSSTSPAQPQRVTEAAPGAQPWLSRRGAMVAAVGGLGAAVAGVAAAAPAAAAAGQGVVLGAVNDGGGTITTVSSATGTQQASFAVTNPASFSNSLACYARLGAGSGLNSYGAALMGDSQAGFGVIGASLNSIAVYAVSRNSVGVRGVSTAAEGVRGSSTEIEGVYGTSVNGYGVHGYSSQDVGVIGRSSTNFGVRAEGTEGGLFATSQDGPGIYTESTAPTRAGLEAHNTSGPAISGTSESSDAVQAYANGGGIAVRALAKSGVAVQGTSTSNYGVFGVSATTTGVRGSSTSGVGISGTSTSSHGMYGVSEKGVGVVGKGGRAPLRLTPATTAGKPTTGAHSIGEMWCDSAGALYVCTAAGTPGTWKKITVS